MPKRSDTTEVKSNNNRKVDARNFKRLPQKSAQVALPIRTGRETGHRIVPTQRAQVPRHRNAISTSAETSPSSGGSGSTSDQELGEVEEVFQTQQPPPEHQDAPLISWIGEPHFDGHNGILIAKTDTQEDTRLQRMAGSPYVILGPGGSDPFATLPTDLPQAFLKERLHISK
jgi:hypothetical protein